MPLPSYLQGRYLRVSRVCTGSMKFLTLPATPVQVIHAGQNFRKKIQEFQLCRPALTDLHIMVT